MYREFRPASDADRALLNRHYAPRTPQNIPSAGIVDSPTYCLEINAEWLPHVLGALKVLDQPDAWKGTETEIEAARDQIRQLMTSGLCE